MLPGDEELKKDFMADVFAYANERGVVPLYIGMAGSRSKGMDSVDSDYDTRVLYVTKDGNGRIILPWEEDEKTLHQKFYTNEKSEIRGKPWEFIPFWEATSFFQFLKCPKFKDCDISSGLYRIVGWTMKSPYSWDPYGLQMKIVPLLDSIFRPDYEIGWYKEEIGRYWSKESDSMLMKRYMKSVHAALCLSWLKNCHGVPPIDKYALLYGNPAVTKSFIDEFERYLLRYRKECSEYTNAHKDGQLYESHTVLKCEKIKAFDDFIEQMKDVAVESAPICDDRLDFVIDKIESLLFEALKKSQAV